MVLKAVMDALLDEAFHVLQHDSGEHDPEYVWQRNELRRRFERVLGSKAPAVPTARVTANDQH